MTMKAVLIAHNEAIDKDVNEALDSVGISCFTKFTNVLGKGEISEPRLDTEVWPGTNYCTFVVTDPAKGKEIMDKIRQLRKKLGTEGLKAFMWEIDDVT